MTNMTTNQFSFVHFAADFTKTAALAPVSVILIFSGLLYQDPAGDSLKSQNGDPKVAFDRARVAQELGDFASAEKYLKQIIQGPGDPALAAAAGERITKINGIPSRGQAGAQGSSPIERRVSEEIDRYQKGITNKDDFRNEISKLGEAAFPAIAARISDPATLGGARDELVIAMGLIGGERAVDYFEKWATTSTDELLVRSALNGFNVESKSSKDYKYAVVVRLLTNRDANVRASAISLLSKLGRVDELKKNLPSILKDESAEVRLALANSNIPLDDDLVRKLVSDQSVKVKKAIANNFSSRARGNPSLDSVSALFTDPSPDVREAIIIPIAQRDWAPADREKLNSMFSQFAKDPSESVRRVAARHLGTKFGAANVPVLLEMALDADFGVRMSALSSTSAIQSTDLRPEHIHLVHESFNKYIEIYGFPRSDSGVQNGSNEWATVIDRLARVAKDREQHEELLQIFIDVPEATEWSGGPLNSILSRAPMESLPKICEVYGKAKNTSGRMRILDAIASRVRNGLTKDISPAIAAIRDALSPAVDPNLRGIAFQAAVASASDELLPTILSNLELFGPDPGNSKTWSTTLSFLNSAGTRSQTFAFSILFAVLKRGPLDSFNNDNAETNYLQASRLLRDIISISDADEIVNLLLDPEFRAKIDKKREWNSAARIAGALGKLPAETHVPAFTKIYGLHPRIDDATLVYTKIDSPEGLAFIIKFPLQSESDDLAAKVIDHLAENRIFTENVTKPVLARAANASANCRVAITEFCAAWNSPEAVPTVRQLLKDKNSAVRQGAARALGRLLAEDAAPDLIQALADDNNEVRKEAKAALEQIKLYHTEKRDWEAWYKKRGADPTDATQKLLDMLKDPAEDVRIAAIESLATMKAKEALPVLVEKLKKTAAGAEREAVAKAIAKINQ